MINPCHICMPGGMIMILSLWMCYHSMSLKVLWNRSRNARLFFWIPDPVFKTQTWLVNPTSSRTCDQAIILARQGHFLWQLFLQPQVITGAWVSETKMLLALLSAVMLARSCALGQRPRGRELIYANIIIRNTHASSIFELRNDFRFRAPLNLQSDWPHQNPCAMVCKITRRLSPPDWGCGLWDWSFWHFSCGFHWNAWSWNE